MKCQCCGNEVKPSSGVTFYWLQGENFVWSVCYVCWAKPFLKAHFLNEKGDIPNKLIKKFGAKLGYTAKEIKGEIKNGNMDEREYNFC